MFLSRFNGCDQDLALPDAAINNGDKEAIFKPVLITILRLISQSVQLYNSSDSYTRKSSVMAPKIPPVPARNPRRQGSSSNNRVQKKPAPLRPSASQTSGRNQVLRGASGSNATQQNATRAATVSSWTSRVQSEDDEHAGTEVDVAMLATALDESIRDNHAELERRVNSGGKSPQLVEVSRHLLESPPTSPNSLSSDGSPKSPVAMARLAKIQTQELNELSKKDAEFHRMMSDLTGIQEWWKGNKVIWHEMRENIREYDTNITALQEQVKQHRRMVWDGASRMSTFRGSFSDERWAPQIEQLTQMRDANMEWFVNNRKLMKAVWARVKEMGGTLYMENKDNRKLGSKYPATRDITQFYASNNLFVPYLEQPFPPASSEFQLPALALPPKYNANFVAVVQGSRQGGQVVGKGGHEGYDDPQG